MLISSSRSVAPVERSFFGGHFSYRRRTTTAPSSSLERTLPCARDPRTRSRTGLPPSSDHSGCGLGSCRPGEEPDPRIPAMEVVSSSERPPPSALPACTALEAFAFALVRDFRCSGAERMQTRWRVHGRSTMRSTIPGDFVSLVRRSDEDWRRSRG